MAKKAILFTLVLAPLLALLLIGTHVTFILNERYDGPDTNFTVHTGDTFGRVNQRLYNQGLISNTRLFHYYAKYKNALTRLRAGEFTIVRGSKMTDVLHILVNGTPNLKVVTIPEGKNMYEIAKLMEQAGICKEQDFLDAVQHPDFISQLELSAPSLEGYLYPETYSFAANTPARQVVKTMVDLFQKRTEELSFEHPFLNKHQVVILASLVEKETGAKFERPTIAGVFTNRLKKRMRLQSDPTTIYGMWHRYTGNIRKSDLQEHTPYNTYRIPALPLGPISNPSLEAIRAVLDPEDHEYLFFVSKNDGTHVFSKTYKDHRKAVEDYQKNANARKGKSWRQLEQ